MEDANIADIQQQVVRMESTLEAVVGLLDGMFAALERSNS